MRRLIFVLSVLFVLMVAAAPALAQDVPAEPQPFSKTELVLIGALFVVTAVFTLFNVQITRVVKGVMDKLPGVVTEVLKAGADTGYARLEEIVEATPSEADDELAARIRAELERLGLLTPEAPAPSPGVHNVRKTE